LAILDLEQSYIVKAKDFMTKCKISPFEGMQFKGRALAVIVNGKLIETGATLCKQ